MPFWRLCGLLGGQLAGALKSWEEGRWLPTPFAAFSCGPLFRGPACLASFRLDYMLCTLYCSVPV